MLMSRFFLLLPLLFVLPAVADTLWLDNGDRLTGRIELMEGNKLIIRTEVAGQVAVNVDRIRTLESDGPLLIKTSDDTKHARRIQASDVAGEIMLVNGEPEPQALRISSLRQLMEPQPIIEDWAWNGRANLSLELEDTESKKRDFDVKATTEARHGDWRHVLAGEFERDYRNDIKSRHRWEADYALSWFFAEKWFWQNSVSYQRDHIDEVARQIQIGSGPGYEWWNNALGRFETSASFQHLRMDARDGSDSRTNGLGLEWDYRRFLFGKRFQLVHNAETIIPNDDQVDYILDAELGLRYLLNSWASLSLATEWDYIRSSDEKSRNETRYKIGLGVNW
ncbi:DUF481 domain-containing protein [Pseudomonas sp. MYb185]|uniref:DUF481 domain-containing protein n=1 Tax=Pseudomonas sp. MYb185 TaxID=1848729 RepID=UPI000CFB6690|nr:DUF481 domain-containing protein [Pseudomonas sp. MYb185]PRB84526.1 peptide chain release factor RF-3 [Pseudomonas sp. MYb185]